MNRHQSKTVREPIINAEVVKTRRRALGLTQVQLALMAACSQSTIRQIEQGKKLDPVTSVTLRIAKSLSVTVEALCRDARPYTSRYATNRHEQLDVHETDPE
jgi:DNA-binding XRE family transcriptional regulator